LSASSSFAEPGAPVVEFAGPGIPAGFVLRTITCNTAIFDRPAGQAVGSNRVTSGQTWYINSKPSDPDANGRRWTEIFVSGFLNGYIPAECVGGQESLAPVTFGLPSGSFGVVPGVPAVGGSVAGSVGVLTGGANGTVSVNGAGQTVYTVAAGDRLYRIALKFGISVTALATANGITNFNLIYPGQQLIIPL
jgi:nucleoid-associated protein YgaU